MRPFPRVLYGYRGVGMAWARLWNGYGVAIKDTRRAPLSFSERMGITKALVLGPYRMTWLTPWGMR